MLREFYFIVLVLLFLPFSAIANEGALARVNNLDQPFDISPFVETIEDVNQEFMLEDVLAGEHDHLWQPVRSSRFVGRNFNSKYWFRFRVQWGGSLYDSAILMIDLPPALISRIGLVIPSGTGGAGSEFVVGQRVPYSARAINDFKYYFPLVMDPFKPKTLIGWVQNNDITLPVQLPFILMSEEAYFEYSKAYFALVMAFYSAMITLLIYNGFLFLTLREPVYGVYLFFLSFSTLMCANFDGVAARYIWPTQPEVLFVGSYFIALVIGAAYLCFVVCAISEVLQWKLIKRAVWLVAGIGVAISIYSLFATNMILVSGFAQAYSGVVMAFVMVIILRAMYFKIPTANYLFVAEVAIISGVAGFVLLIQGYVPIHPVTVWGWHWGLGGEAILLSLALAARTRIIQQAAVDNLQKYEKIYHDSIEGLFQFDVVNNALKSNDAFARLLGFDSSKALPQDPNVLDYFSLEDQNSINSALVEKGIIQDFELEIVQFYSKKKLWLSITMRSMSNEKNAVIRVEGSMIDITERKLKEQAQKESIEHLHHAEKVKNEFLSTMSHELLTPMNGIVGYIELLKSETQEDKNVLGLERSSSEMMSLVDRILNFTQLQAGNLSVDTTMFPLNSIVAPLESVYKNRCKSKGLNFFVNIAEAVPDYICGDLNKISGIIDDLLSNAVKFTAAGEVRLVIDAKPGIDENICSMLFSVQDTGIGVSKEDREKIFTLFRQADGSFKREHGGLGLGLAMCREFSDLMGGSLGLLSEPGKGSQFDFILDVVVERRSVPRDEPKPLGDAILKEACILVVEDNQINQLVLQGILRKLGHRTYLAENGIKALELLEEESFDIILMDCQMPVMDGFEATRKIRMSNGNHKATPIIAVTANAMAGDRERCIEAGMDDYMRKPVKKLNLNEKINYWLKHSEEIVEKEAQPDNVIKIDFDRPQ